MGGPCPASIAVIGRHVSIPDRRIGPTPIAVSVCVPAAYVTAGGAWPALAFFCLTGDVIGEAAGDMVPSSAARRASTSCRAIWCKAAQPRLG